MDQESIIDNMRLKVETKLPKVSEYLFFASFFIYIITQYLGGTMFTVDGTVSFLLLTISSILAFIKIIIFDDESNLYKLTIVLLLIILFAAGKNSFDYNFYYYAFLIFAAKNIEFRKILKYYIIVLASGIIVTAIFALIHVIPAIVITRSNSSALRLALGSVYPSDLAARIFHLMVGYAVLKKFKLTLPEYLSIIAITITTYIVTDTKLDLILMILLIICLSFYKYIVILMSMIKPYIFNLLILGFIAINILLAYFYNPKISILNKLNSALTGRLDLANRGFNDYNVTLYGQYVYQNGWGGIHKKIIDYFYIDSSLVRVLLMQGLIVYIILICLMLRDMKIFVKNKQFSLAIALFFIIASSAIDQHLIEITFNFVFLASFANIDYFKDDRLS
ncbi:polymerase [Ligilactobacillus salivarius]|uniref:polymerase n=1 Tax=Ligilactobacillus salivarius TaxID=1624 RepID=UPI00191F05F9|nr:polymerase [Ligilactobacillus salivarius]MBL1057231.1 polymerase [Ligilactobacillus salivarius]